MAIKATVNRANTAAIAARTSSKKEIQAKSIAVGSAGRIQDLSDVDLGDIADGKVLTYDAATGKFKGIESTGFGKQRLNDLNDIDVTQLQQGAMVVWDEATQKWVAKQDIQDGTSLNGGRY